MLLLSARTGVAGLDRRAGCRVSSARWKMWVDEVKLWWGCSPEKG
ncbi:hypothetical protein Hanom_Chr04g00351161 [Helianthus anomalus]